MRGHAPFPTCAVRADADPGIVGVSLALKQVLVLAERVAAGSAKVLITGESGVGKDLIARHIHSHSSRGQHRFVAVNCAALSDTLLESELFGHVKGSFTGAYRDKIGTLKLADQGTIFLDEIGEMSLRMQVLLLRFLENGEIQPVGADKTSAPINARVIAATNRNLAELVVSGAFREDLLYRVQVGHIHVPPLRHRREDIRPLVEHTIARTGRPIHFGHGVWELLESYQWPGNVRELQNVVEQLAWMSGGEKVDVEDLPAALRAGNRTRVFVRERRRQPADDLFADLVSGRMSFWDDIYRMFLSRDLTRHDLRELVRRGLAATNGNYRATVKLFGLPPTDYKRFLNFIAAHKCHLDLRVYRATDAPAPAPALSSPVAARASGRAAL
jgi:transcriptional regulator with PAS, ATPase and Fis domain